MECAKYVFPGNGGNASAGNENYDLNSPFSSVTDINYDAVSEFLKKRSSNEKSEENNKQAVSDSYTDEWESKSTCSFEEPVSARTRGSWDLPSGPIAWDDRDLTFEQLLHYADLTLTEEEESGVLTDRIIAACASYLTRSPASKSHIVAKVCLDNKNLNDIRIIAYHRFLQYVDLSWNNIKDLSPLGNLPYLMYLDVSHNSLEEVLQFKPPWNLTYVNYSYNEVWKINDLSDFWSLCYLDLSHNKISKIQGLGTLRYLRYLNLSHNKITRFENLNHTRITDLNLEFNLISTFEMGKGAGVKTMLNLSSLCLNNNMISDLEFLKGVYHLKKLELQGNRITNLLELKHMKSLRKLALLDLSGNPVSKYKPYRNLVLNILPDLRYLDQTEVHLSEKMDPYLDATTKILAKAAQNNARMILLDQLNDNPLELDVLPIDQPSYPLVILVGPSASGKKLIVSKILEKCADKNIYTNTHSPFLGFRLKFLYEYYLHLRVLSANEFFQGRSFGNIRVFVGKIHTTRIISEVEHPLLISIRREAFNEKIKKGHFFCVTEKLGNFYGFSKEMLALAVKHHKLCLTYMDLEGALTLNAYGIQPYLVLTILSSEKEHNERLKKNYGPVITLLGAAYIAKRNMKDTHGNNLRRVKEIIYDIIEEVVFWVDERHNLSFASGRHYGRGNTKELNAGRIGFRPSLSVTDHDSAFNFRHTSYMSAKNNSMNKKFDYVDKCSSYTCALQDKFKPSVETDEDATTDYSRTNIHNTTSEEEMKDEDSGTCSTSYSAVLPPALKLSHFSFDDEGSFGGEDDIFADWSSPFVDWDEVNIDPVSVEEAAEELCQKFISRVLSSRNIYESIHQENPGLFSRVLLTDNEEEAVKNLTEFLRDVWRSVPEKRPLIDIGKDHAYQEIVPKRLEKLKRMIRGEKSSMSDDRTCAESFVQINSPRTIVTQMQIMGYEDSVEMA